MARPPDPEIRRKLRDRAVDYVLTHGFSDLSLRPLAAAIQTNARMLVYHFGSREGLMREILAGLREREDANVKAWFEKHSKAAPDTLLKFVRWYWKRVASAQASSAVKLIFELYGLALRDPMAYPGVLEEPVAYWKKLALLSGYRGKQAEAIATLMLAATRGLMLDAVATRQRARINRALKLLISSSAM